jgi:hypothetical protein
MDEHVDCEYIDFDDLSWDFDPASFVFYEHDYLDDCPNLETDRSGSGVRSWRPSRGRKRSAGGTLRPGNGTGLPGGGLSWLT